MLNTVIVGASGYAGAELAALVQNHPELKLFGLYVSAGSQDAHKRFSSLHPQWVGALDQPLLPLDEDGMTRILTQADLVLLATAHEVSAELAPKFLAKGLPVFDLSGAFRVKDQGFYDSFYGFTHDSEQWLDQAVYGLAEWNSRCHCRRPADCGARLLPDRLALRPQAAAAGRSDCRGVAADHQRRLRGLRSRSQGRHQHQLLRSEPEPLRHLQSQTPAGDQPPPRQGGAVPAPPWQLCAGHPGHHLCATGGRRDALPRWIRPILKAYEGKPLVRLTGQMPSIRGVANTPYCDLAWQQQGNMLVVVSAIDNLLKGAASQAMQCINIKFGFEPATGLI
jgi:N-acetyl-gamma-glutamyl-phosphate reductase